MSTFEHILDRALWACLPAVGYCRFRNQGPLCWEPRTDKCSPFKAWTRSEYIIDCVVLYVLTSCLDHWICYVDGAKKKKKKLPNIQCSELQVLSFHFSGCRSGKFGWNCNVACRCKPGTNLLCDEVTGQCPEGCDDNSYGPHCLFRKWWTIGVKVLITTAWKLEL